MPPAAATLSVAPVAADGRATIGAVADGMYHCPGEKSPISRSIHLARLAAGHAACRDCPARGDLESLPAHIAKRVELRHARPRFPLISREGIRGLFLNELTRAGAKSLTAEILNIVDEDFAVEDRRAPGPIQALTGHDGRAASPELALGVVATLRQFGCDTMDVGAVSRPHFDFAFDQLRPDVALFVTGGCRPDGWVGLDVIGAGGLPWCEPGLLTRLRDRIPSSACRLSRLPGLYRPLTTTGEYTAALHRQFHALRPLKLAVSCADPIVRQTLQRVLDETPCRLHLASEHSLEESPADRPLRNFAESLCERRVDVGFAVARDGRAVRVLDETGVELDALQTAALLRQLLPRSEVRPVWLRSENAAPWSAAEETLTADAPAVGTGPADDSSGLLRVALTEAELIRAQRERQLPIVGDEEGRFWFLRESPACDAVQTVARVLEAISLSEESLSLQRRAARTPLSSSPVRSGRPAWDPPPSSRG